MSYCVLSWFGLAEDPQREQGSVAAQSTSSTSKNKRKKKNNKKKSKDEETVDAEETDMAAIEEPADREDYEMDEQNQRSKIMH